jgi:hypothetical protein
MIPAHLLHRLLVNLIDSATAIELDEGTETSDAAHRERLEDFAGLHELDLEDTATLFRVAAGEDYQHPPTYPGRISSGLLNIGRTVALDIGHDELPPIGTPVTVTARQEPTT